MKQIEKSGSGERQPKRVLPKLSDITSVHDIEDLPEEYCIYSCDASNHHGDIHCEECGEDATPEAYIYDDHYLYFCDRCGKLLKTEELP